MYNEKVMEIFKNPANMGDLKGANAIGQVGNMACGDIMKIFLKINDKGIIEDAKFKTFGCVAAIVSSSIACGLVKGMTIEEALNFDNNKVIEEVGELPTHKIHCSILAKEAIEDAINNYRKNLEKAKKKAEKEKLSQKEEKVKSVAEKVKKVNDKKDEKESTQKEQKTNINKLNSLLSKLDKKK